MRALILSLSLLVACNNPPAAESQVLGAFPQTGEVLIKVNGVDVTDKMMAAVTRNTPAPEIEKRKQTGTWLKMLEQVGLGEVLYQEALRAGIQNDEEVKLSVAMSAREVLAQEHFQKLINARVSDADILKTYDERAVQYKRPQARASHILVKDETIANELLARLAKGETFSDLAAQYSEDPATKDTGGDLGWFQKNKLLPEVATVAFDGELNKPVGPVQTRFGYHLILPTDRREAIPLEDVKEEIRNELQNKSAEQVIKELKDGLKIEYFGEAKKLMDQTGALGIPGASPPGELKGPQGMSAPGGGAPPGAPHGADDGHGHDHGAGSDPH